MFKWNNNKVIAHRGAWKLHKVPQNSIAALKQAIKLGCYGSEFDVWMTEDGILVVNHDPDFLGVDIETSSYAQVLAKSHPNGEKIATLESYLLEGMKQFSTKLILEIKPSQINAARTLAVAERCVELVVKLGASAWVEFISFDYEVCKMLIKLLTNANVAYLNGDVSAVKLKQDKITGADYNLEIFKKDPKFIAEAHKLGLTTNVWTVDKLSDIRFFLNENVDFITTNEPELVLKESKKRLNHLD